MFAYPGKLYTAERDVWYIGYPTLELARNERLYIPNDFGCLGRGTWYTDRSHQEKFVEHLLSSWHARGLTPLQRSRLCVLGNDKVWMLVSTVVESPVEYQECLLDDHTVWIVTNELKHNPIRTVFPDELVGVEPNQ